jgi:hypothetical protein
MYPVLLSLTLLFGTLVFLLPLHLPSQTIVIPGRAGPRFNLRVVQPHFCCNTPLAPPCLSMVEAMPLSFAEVQLTLLEAAPAAL